MSETRPAQVALRPAASGDCRRLWEWRNEAATREASFNRNPIPYPEHERWFSRKVQDPDTRIFIVLDEAGREVGYLRFDIHADGAEIGVGMDKAERGRGYGSAAIRLGSDSILDSGDVTRVVAYVKTENPASLGAFRRAGFIDAGVKRIGDMTAHELSYERTLQEAGGGR